MTLAEFTADITLHPEKIDSLLEVLHLKAKNCDSFEYGLPIYGPEKDGLRMAVLQWIIGLNEGAK